MAVACLYANRSCCNRMLVRGLERAKEPRKMSYPWFALQLRNQYENIVTAQLSGKGYEWFLPLYKCRRRWSDRYSGQC